MLGELIIIYQISWANHIKYRSFENEWIYDVFQVSIKIKCFFQVSIKEGDEEKVDEMRGREKLVRTPQQVKVVFLLYFFYICMLVYLYLGCISMAFPLYFYCTLLWSRFLFAGEQQRAWMFHVCVFVLYFYSISIVFVLIFVCISFCRGTTKGLDAAEVLHPSWLGSGQTSK